MTINLYEDDAFLKNCQAEITDVNDLGICLNQTVFYSTGGGQPGDSGVLTLENGDTIKIKTTIKDRESGEIMHVPEEDQVDLKVGAKVVASIDWDRRYQHMKMHSCLHLLCSLIDADVTGCSIGEEKSRLDFDLPDQLLDKEKITADLNELIKTNYDINSYWISDDELKEKPELVRTMSVKPPTGYGRVRVIDINNVDKQPCGGTHVIKTGEIGPIKVQKIQKKSTHNRRITIAFDN